MNATIGTRTFQVVSHEGAFGVLVRKPEGGSYIMHPFVTESAAREWASMQRRAEALLRQRPREPDRRAG